MSGGKTAGSCVDCGKLTTNRGSEWVCIECQFKRTGPIIDGAE